MAFCEGKQELLDYVKGKKLYKVYKTSAVKEFWGYSLGPFETYEEALKNSGFDTREELEKAGSRTRITEYDLEETLELYVQERIEKYCVEQKKKLTKEQEEYIQLKIYDGVYREVESIVKGCRFFLTKQIERWYDDEDKDRKHFEKMLDDLKHNEKRR